MKTFIVREHDAQGVLISLERILSRLPEMPLSRWCFKEIAVNAGLPFGLHPAQFEERTRVPGGYCVSQEDFTGFVGSGIQIVEGTIEGYLTSASEPVVRIECQDATQWKVDVMSD